MATNIRIEYEINDKELKENKALLERVNKEQNLTQKEVEQTNSKFEKQDKQLSKTNKLLSGLSGQLRTTANNINLFGVGLGDLGANAGKAVTGIGGMSKALRIFKIALASTGIGLLIVALGSLVAFFSKSQRGIDKANQAFAAIGATVSVFTDRLAILGEKLINLDFSNLLDVFSGITDEIQREATAASTLEAALQRVRDAEIELNIQRANSRARIKELNLIAEDITKSDQERADAAREAIRIESDLLSQQIELQQKKVAIIAQQNALGESTVEDVQREADARIELANIQESSLELQTTLNNKLNIIEQQRLLKEQKRLQTIQDEVDELSKMSKELSNITRKADKLSETIRSSFGENGIAKTAEEALKKAGVSIKKTRDKIQKDSDERRQKEQQKEQQRQEIINFGVEKGIEIANQASEQRINNLQREFEVLELQKEAELALAGNNADQRAKIEEKFAQKAIEAKIREAKAEKVGALFSIAINTASAIIKQLAATPLPLGAPLVAAIAATGAAQGAVVAAQPLPKFRQGGQVGGRRHEQGGTLIEAEKGEFILRREAVDKYGLPMLESLNNMNLSPQLVVMNDNKELAKLFKERPENKLIWDENGFQSYTLRKGNIIQKKAKRYSI